MLCSPFAVYPRLIIMTASYKTVRGNRCPLAAESNYIDDDHPSRPTPLIKGKAFSFISSLSRKFVTQVTAPLLLRSPVMTMCKIVSPGGSGSGVPGWGSWLECVAVMRHYSESRNSSGPQTPAATSGSAFGEQMAISGQQWCRLVSGWNSISAVQGFRETLRAYRSWNLPKDISQMSTCTAACSPTALVLSFSVSQRWNRCGPDLARITGKKSEKAWIRISCYL